MPAQPNKTFSKKERLCSQKIIGNLFVSGKVLKQFPFKVVYACCSYNESPVKIVVSVPKKIHKRAVKRNLIRRRIKEVYRLNKDILYNLIPNELSTLNIMLIYVSPVVADYAEIEKKLISTLTKLAEDIKKNPDIYSGSSN